ncbi:BCCT family transporter [Pseudoalteromonas sp. McH1-7]|uniref:Betaine/carnitine transporter, BCCT family n=1 Tax=Pseudoalteromonas peptidolytica F12-50-A1 TaxID=1315280 RepID=A0A8I0MVM6_9GAMM|nr:MULTISPECIES: BCCT family transporter [Pseudoalteromonas]MBE0346700.1 betaine/carnitine transporter, BCCT family [Pseudoalteromonas peptidolytica F12-50-A1]MDW7549879.1 BCCT family transporter [Pseudoalteromonas peptidolytica]NLR13612.1 BCCT family transporter [Pseudoalteromonas peptidolytica]NUZ09419.1 BCCT family transporter [Pseudoalteromonas sp. McH1-7]RXE94867.1 BCCT family transporter [Pseudoalteromonas sp. PS5]
MGNNHDKYSIDNTDYTVGQDNVQKWGFDVHNPVFGVSAGLILAFLIAVLLVDANTAKTTLDGIKWDIIGNFDVLFMWSGNFFVLFCLVLVLSPYGKIRLGGENAKPSYSRASWLAMLFAAGMGIGLMFWGVAEPVAYYTGWYETPLNVAANTPEAAELAMGATMYHWGLHPWAIYAVVALSLAFFAYNKGLPLSIRSIFYPILGDRAWGWPGHIIDILAVLATLFGLATSLGLGAQQAGAGIQHVFGIEAGLSLEIAVIAGVTVLAIISVVRGIDGGVKLLSNINMLIAFALLLFVGIAGFAIALGNIPTTLMAYIENIIPLSNPHGRDDEAWFQGWTVFYWAWWISWSPFVGMFIARVSEGRTIREFITAVLLIPTLVTVIWMSIYGGLAIDQVKNGIGALGTNGLTEVPLAMFQMFENLPMSDLLSFTAILLVLVFFITSSDSGSLVIDSITAGGKIDAPVPQRIFWASIEGAIAAALLWIGGKEAIEALQAGAISTGLPFTFVLLLMCVSLILGLRTEPKS